MIELVDVYKSFGDLHVLKGVNLRLQEGETVVILGRSGTGKSVTLKHIVGRLAPDKGQILVDKAQKYLWEQGQWEDPNSFLVAS